MAPGCILAVERMQRISRSSVYPNRGLGYTAGQGVEARLPRGRESGRK